MRTDKEIQIVLTELLDKIWYNRHLVLLENVVDGIKTVDPQIWEGACKSAGKLEKKYSSDELGPYSDWDWGFMNGKLAAIRWMLGEDWETTLDT